MACSLVSKNEDGKDCENVIGKVSTRRDRQEQNGEEDARNESELCPDGPEDADVEVVAKVSDEFEKISASRQTRWHEERLAEEKTKTRLTSKLPQTT